MPINLSVVRRLRQRGQLRRRSLEGKLPGLIDETVRRKREISPAELLREVPVLGLRTSADAADIVRADRDRQCARRLGDTAPAFDKALS